MCKTGWRLTSIGYVWKSESTESAGSEPDAVMLESIRSSCCSRQVIQIYVEIAPCSTVPTCSTEQVSIVTPTAGDTIPANNCRSTVISSCCITPLELIAIRHLSIFISVCLPSTSQNISFSPVFSWHCLPIILCPRGLCKKCLVLLF